jgi:hypothetical protein
MRNRYVRSILPAILLGLAGMPVGVAIAAPSIRSLDNISGTDVVSKPACPPTSPDRPKCEAEILVNASTGAPVHPQPTQPMMIKFRSLHAASASTTSPATVPSPSETTGVSEPVIGSPASLLQAYDLSYLSQTGGGTVTIALVELEDDPNAESDLNYYRSTFGLPSCTTQNGCFRRVDQNGGTNYPPVEEHENASEVSLDMDAVSAVCPNCHLLVVEAGETEAVAQATAARLGANVISDSWVRQTPDALYETFTFPGIATVASSGDRGYDVQPYDWAYPAPSTLPNTTSAGGTVLLPASLSKVSSARGYTETAWSGSGSSCDPEITKPPWQADGGCAGRTTSDVSADGGTSIFVYDSSDGGWIAEYGTSLSAPLIAAYYSVTDAAAQNPSWVYQSAPALNDITSGSNGTCPITASYLCIAGVGYDGPTGVGSISGSAVRGAPGLGGPSMVNGTYTQEASYDITSKTVSATLAGGVYTNGLETSYWWQYGKTVFEHETPAVSVGASCSITPVTTSLSGLEANASYSYRLVAHNALGTAYGYDSTLDTSPDELPTAESPLPPGEPTTCPVQSPVPDVPNPTPPPTPPTQSQSPKSGSLAYSHSAHAPTAVMSKLHVSRGSLVMRLQCRGAAHYTCVIRVVVSSGRWKRSITVRIAAGHTFSFRLRLGKMPRHSRRLQVALYLAGSHGKYRKLAHRSVAVR